MGYRLAHDRHEAHPRSRWEHYPRRDDAPDHFGSSPLARGTPTTINRVSSHRRLIPAHAGSTRAPWHEPAPNRAHPRSRGEHTDLLQNSTPEAGSSPLARGTHAEHAPPVIVLGLIPARTGNTEGVQARVFPSGAHPRSRGEHPTALADFWGKVGSSQLLRGTYQSDAAEPVVARLIPARAGST